MDKHSTTCQQFTAGIRTGIPVAIGYIPIAIAYGLLARSFDIPPSVTLLMSFLVFAGASQFIAVQLMVSAVSPWEVIITTFILNLRHFLMTASLSQRLPDTLNRRWLALLAFGVTDETFSVASMQSERILPAPFLLGLNLIAFAAWNGGTWAGVFLAMGMPQTLQNSMGIALYAMFIGLLIPSLRGSRTVAGLCLIALLVSGGLHWGIARLFPLSTGWLIILTTLLSSALGVLVFPEEADDHD